MWSVLELQLIHCDEYVEHVLPRAVDELKIGGVRRVNGELTHDLQARRGEVVNSCSGGRSTLDKAAAFVGRQIHRMKVFLISFSLLMIVCQ